MKFLEKSGHKPTFLDKMTRIKLADSGKRASTATKNLQNIKIIKTEFTSCREMQNPELVHIPRKPTIATDRG